MRIWQGRAAAGVAVLVVSTVIGVAAAIAPAAASVPSPTKVYDAIGPTVPGNVVSVGFEATASSEFGDLVRLAPGGRLPKSATVLMSSWGCESGAWFSGDCATSTNATFSHGRHNTRADPNLGGY